MSYDFFIYSPSEQPVNKEDLKVELEKRGWKVFFAAPSSGPQIKGIVSSSGPLENGAFLLTCEADDENLPRFVEAVENDDLERLNAMLENYEIDFCGLWWSLFDFVKEYGADAEEAAQRFGSQELAAAIKQARTHYSFDVSYEDFYLYVAQAIGDLVGGVLEDPQTGAIEFKEAKG